MSDLRAALAIELAGLKPGNYTLHWVVGDDFLQEHPHGLVQTGLVQVRCNLVRLDSGAIEMTFHLNGNIDVECSRCGSPLTVPIKEEAELFARFADVEAPDYDGDQLVLVPHNAQKLEVADFVSDTISLSVPMRAICEDYRAEGCPPEARELFERLTNPRAPSNEEGNTDEASGGDASKSDPRWDALKKLRDAGEQ